jgi:hypothetical protein
MKTRKNRKQNRKTRGGFWKNWRLFNSNLTVKQRLGFDSNYNNCYKCTNGDENDNCSSRSTLDSYTYHKDCRRTPKY